ncbi:MAG TPA: hypothetical protein VLK30_01475 [Candidatus Limnocylindrales bacterium]|nr:hypothetical protein [Candidatus Limnocylindrales bacterium]
MSEMERRSADRRVAERDTMRGNPEVMGRTEPRAMVEEPVRSEPAPVRVADVSPEMNDIRMRFEQLQSEFIDDPHAAVKKAERLMEEAIDRMAKMMRERMQSIHRDIDGNSDTEGLRVVMRGYREMIDKLGSPLAA